MRLRGNGKTNPSAPRPQRFDTTMDKKLVKENIITIRSLAQTVRCQVLATLRSIGSMEFTDDGVTITTYDDKEYVIRKFECVDDCISPIVITGEDNNGDLWKLQSYQYDQMTVWLELLNAVEDKWDMDEIEEKRNR